MRAALFAVLFLLCSVLPAKAEVVVSLITFGPGAETFEKFGHTALRIRDDEKGIDLAYNWGVFSAKDEVELITRFVQGRIEYWMERSDSADMLNWYGNGQNRSIWEQELNLTAAEKRAIIVKVLWNEQPANRYYKYDYYRDNCTTRARDVIDQAIGGKIAAALQNVPTGTTYRSHTRALVAGDPALYTGLQAVLAAWVDQPLDAWKESFLPFELQRHLRDVKTTDEAGNVVPLVRNEKTLFTGVYPIPDGRVPTYWPWYLLIGVVGGGIMVLLAGPARTKVWAAGALFLPILLWSFVGGIGGAIMGFAWAFTDHVVAYRNENLLQTNAILFAMIPLAFVALVFRRGRTLAYRVAAVVAVLSVVGVAMKVLPWFRQNNADIVALALPLNVGLAVAMGRLRGPIRLGVSGEASTLQTPPTPATSS